MKICDTCGNLCRDSDELCARCRCTRFHNVTEDWATKQDSTLSMHTDHAALGANAEMLGRYSEAGKQFKVAYDGVDNSTGQKLHQSLKHISEGKVNPDYAEQNIRQQAGYSAEVLDTAKQNAERIKNGDPTRVSRTDDLGRVNDTRADQVTVDAQGNVVQGSEVQVKFLGVNPKTGQPVFLEKVSGKEWQTHYPDGKFRVPADQYDDIRAGLRQKIEELESQKRTPEKEAQLAYLKKVEKNLEKSDVSSKEAIDTRLNPEQTTAKEILKTANEAGIHAMATSAAVGGGISLLTNAVAVLQGDKDPAEAAADTIKDTMRSGATGYVTGFANTTLASVMKNSSNELIRMLGSANGPAYLIQTAVTTVKSMARLVNGEINTDEFFLEIGKSGTTMLASAQGAVIGQMLIPVPVLGAMVGGLVGSLLCGVIYDYTVAAKGVNQEIEAFTGQLRAEIRFLRAYQAHLMSYDLERFKQETETFNALGEYISGDYTTADFHTMLRLTYAFCGIPCPWGERSFEDFMADESAVLTFE